jgi:hypothetical protein
MKKTLIASFTALALIAATNVPDISKVQIWCARAELVLGEASFDQAVQVTSR